MPSASSGAYPWLWLLPSLLLLCFLMQVGLGLGIESALELQGMPMPQLLIERPWTLLTYALVHTSWRHLFYNELVLVVAILLWHRGAKEFYLLFAGGVLLGALIFLLLPTPAEGVVLTGASVGVGLLLVVALCRLQLDSWVLLLLLFLIVGVEVSVGVESHQQQDSMILHLSSYLAGLLYLLVTRLCCRIQVRKQHAATVTVEEGDSMRHTELLKKVRQSGYASLSEEEKRTLNE